MIGNQVMLKQSNRFEIHLKYLSKFFNYTFTFNCQEHHKLKGLT